MSEFFNKLFVFEMANNHQGSVEHGLIIIKEIARIVNTFQINAAVKFQYRDLDTFIHPAFVDSKDNKHIPRFLSTKLSANEFITLIRAVKEEGMLSMVTPFDENSVSLCLDHGVDIIKVASCSSNDWPLLETISKTEKPIICSTGGLKLNQIDNIVSFFTHRNSDFAIMHCVGIYPTDNRYVNANFIEKLINRYSDIPIGYSGHEAPDNNDVIKIVIAKGANIFERHVGVETDKIKLNKYSMNPIQAENWIKNALIAMEICGSESTKFVSQDELDSIESLKRGVYTKVKITKGEQITIDKVFFAFPIQKNQISTFEYHESMLASRDYEINSPINEKRIERKQIDAIREIVHDVKGMLYEAKIVVGNEFRIEISHHYGLDHFRQNGAVLIDVINRSYCKKLILVFPGQKHPLHYHKIKEESFQLLRGDLTVEFTEGEMKKLKPGDVILIEPNTTHGFHSVKGAIFEEVSTTHKKADSYYVDDTINKKDYLERKTIVTNW